jgi:hypothetical protein
MSSKPISDLRRRMISDMTVRSFSVKTQVGDIDSERMPIRVEMGKGREDRRRPRRDRVTAALDPSRGLALICTVPREIPDKGLRNRWPSGSAEIL